MNGKSLINRLWSSNVGYSTGEQIYHYQDPSGGWDGRYHGKLVPPGVYYYVIEARGADGQKYKLKGHINILRSKNK